VTTRATRGSVGRLHSAAAILAWVLLLAGVAASTVTAAEIPFSSPPVISGGQQSATFVDLDGDGDLDVVASGSAGLEWFENTGSGWTQHTSSLAGGSSFAVAAGDVDGDGDADIVATAAGDLAWFENTSGDGLSWSTAKTISASTNSHDIVLADIDRDGDLDVVSSIAMTGMSWFENTGVGWTAHPIDPGNPRAAMVVDLDGDGDLDILAAFDMGDDRIAWYANTDGAGGFGIQQPIGTSLTNATDVAAGDLDGDGDLDVALGYGTNIAWFENTAGDASTWSGAQSVDTPTSTVGGVTAADMDADGDLDLVSSTDFSADVAWHENTAGDASSWVDRPIVSVGFNATLEVHVADVDDDGDLDVAVNGPSLAWFENDTIHRRAAFGTTSTAEAGDEEEAIAPVDLDGDGDLDLVVVNEQGGDVVWLEDVSGDGSNYVLASPAIDASAISGAPFNNALAPVLELGDFDRDGDPDLLVGTDGDDRVVWHENRLDESLGWVETLLDDASGDAQAGVVADLDGDGRLDAAIAFDTGGVRWYRNTGASFDPGVDIDIGTTSRGLEAADLDRDGDLDLVVNDARLAGGSSLFTLGWYENELGDGSSWSAAQTITSDLDSPAALGIGDFDGDGDVDVVACTNGHLPEEPQKEINWYENRLADAQPWEPRQVDPFIDWCIYLTVGDLDGDGSQDLWAGASAQARIYLNQGGGASWETIVENVPSVVVVGIADLNRDGLPDALGTRDEVRWAPNTGGQLALPTTPTASPGIVEGAQDDVLRIDAIHRGRAGDSDAEIVSLELRFEDGASTPLTSIQANDLVNTLSVRLDDGDGVFQLLADVAVGPTIGTLALTGGVQTVAFSDGDPNVAIAHGTPRSYFVVLDLAADASAQTPSQLEVFHVVSSSSTAEDAASDLPLVLEGADDVSTGSVAALAGAGDADGDGLDNAAEITAGSDPYDTDSDDDGLTDGDEVGTHSTDPTNADSDGDGWLDGAEIALGSDPGVPASPPTVPIGAPFVDGGDVSTSVSGALSLAAADLNGDGKLDVVSAAPGTDTVSWHENTVGDGSTWTPRTITTNAEGVAFVTVGDVDRDGKVDVAAASPDDDTVAWFQNEGGVAPPFATEVEVTRDPDGSLQPFEGFADGAAMARIGHYNSINGALGAPDFAIAAPAADQLSVHINSFSASIAWNVKEEATERGVRALFPTDFGADGDTDLFTAASSGELAFYRNDGANGGSSGAFWSRHAIGTADDPRWIEAADIDGDGDPDAISASAGDGRITWWENTGDADTWVPHAVSVAAAGARSVTAADLDLDGDLDLIAALETDDSVVWYENLPGDGSYWSAARILANDAMGAAQAIAADVDSDGDLDVISASADDDTVRWYENRTVHRSAFFPVQTVIESAANQASEVRGADVDRDGDMDVVASSSSEIAWYANDGTPGGEGDWTKTVINPAATDSFELADFDGDGDLDVAGTGLFGDRIFWHDNTDGAGTFGPEQTIANVAGHKPLFAGDFDQDGDLDLLPGGPGNSSGRLVWYENDGTPGGLGDWPETEIDSGLSVRHVEAADIDGDGDLDALAGDNVIAWYVNDGAGNFGARQLVADPTWSSFGTSLVDLDGDGDLDVLAALFQQGLSPTVHSITWYENDGTPGGMGDWFERTITSDVVRPRSVSAFDVDLDGDQDVLVAAMEGDTVSWYENELGDATSWLLHSISDTVDFGNFAWAADIDGDGDLDALSASHTDDTIAWYENVGGQYGLPTTPRGYQGMVESRKLDVLRIDFAHRGRSGDAGEDLSQMGFRIEGALGSLLTDEQAGELIAQIDVHIDDGTTPGVFDPSDSVIATQLASPAMPPLFASTFTTLLAPPTGSASAGGAVTYFLVPRLTAGASGASVNPFQLLNDAGAAQAFDASAALPITQEFVATPGSGLIQALDPTGDADSDGLTNAAEADTHGTDPLNADTDRDGSDDGAEIANGTGPLDPDSDDDGLTDGEEASFGSNPLDEDTDADGVCDGGIQLGACTAAGPDNCILISNNAQTNGDTAPQGDDCQCGDVTGSDGLITANDVLAARENLMSVTPPTFPFTADRCNVVGPYNGGVGDCGVDDIYVLERVANGAAVVVSHECAAFGP
jgi:hypothetical protein